jgi:phenylacetate-CoA ligase
MDIKLENVENIVKIIEQNKIETIYGYSSSVLSLAEYLSKYDYNIKMKYIIVMGEGLLKQQRSIISTNFHCPVYMDYGSSECMRMGFECRYQNGYHMDIYNHFFEYIKDNNYAKNNEIGDIVVTNLNNYIFPFIRYRVGDAVLVSDQSCQCKINFPMVKKIYGRITDPIKTPTGKDLSSGVFFVEFEYLYDYVNQFRVIQTKKDELLVKIVPNEKMNEEQRRKIEKLIYGLTDESMNVHVQLVPEITTLKSGKKRTVISKEEYDRLIKNGEIL